MSERLPQLFKKLIHRDPKLMPTTRVSVEKIGEGLSPNMRALRLVMSLAEQLLSMGVIASDVVHLSLGITKVYCRRRVHLDISSTMITVSQDRGNDREPLTLIRTITPKDTNYQLIQSLQTLALDIRDKGVSLDDAEMQMDAILNRNKSHPWWLLYISGGILSAGVVILYDAAPLMILLAFAMGLLATMLVRWLGNIGVSTFYLQIITAFCITLTAAGASWLNHELMLLINPTLIVISGIVLLVAGMMIVGAFQDAIDEYYVTANARLLKVTMATGGIVIGVLGGLYIATRLGVSFPATPDRLTLADTQLQYIGAIIISAAFAMRNHAPLTGALIAGTIGLIGWWLSRVMLNFEFGIVIASGAAATVIGFAAGTLSRLWRLPSVAIIGAGVVPLVPGLSLYNGLMGAVDNPPGDPDFMITLATLIQAVMIGLAVAAGASLGNIIGRPFRRRAIQIYNRLPRRKLSQK